MLNAGLNEALKLAASGAEKKGMAFDLRIGKTLIGDAGWRVYYAADGSKTMKLADGKELQGRWWRKNGTHCEYSFGHKRDVCGDFFTDQLRRVLPRRENGPISTGPERRNGASVSSTGGGFEMRRCGSIACCLAMRSGVATGHAFQHNAGNSRGIHNEQSPERSANDPARGGSSRQFGRPRRVGTPGDMTPEYSGKQMPMPSLRQRWMAN